MTRIEDREARLRLGIVVERRASSHPWADWVWKPVSVFLEGVERPAPWTELARDTGVTRYYAGGLDLVLHRRETEALRLNLMLERPEVYVALRADQGPYPWVPFRVTASSYESQDLEDSGELLMEKLPMPEPVAAFVQAFAEVHHVEQRFKKRQRDQSVKEERQFSKHPIFMDIRKQ